ncbi:RNA ligase family protein [Stenotrophomonas sp. PS02300]|uniref:RNA ligase family protein n=1 Tax=Stenotrophomonas sp. PS02300 TaxID=2991426 RepID=UPI00249A4707|nr:RNA ligase family protein [Stenotrophomonas sp. PS02300]
MSEFFRFPHTPHLTWLGDGLPRDDKVLSSAEAAALLSGPVVVEEKIDGANLGFSLSDSGDLLIQNRGEYLRAPYSGQFSRLTAWRLAHESSLLDVLTSNIMVFGEWCAARHSIEYSKLPDFFLVFDVYDRETQKFWSTTRRDALVGRLGLFGVPRLFHGRTELPKLIHLLNASLSRFDDGPPEGIVVRRDLGEWCSGRAKLVRSGFTQSISEHWSSRPLRWNRLG